MCVATIGECNAPFSATPVVDDRNTSYINRSPFIVRLGTHRCCIPSVVLSSGSQSHSIERLLADYRGNFCGHSNGDTSFGETSTFEEAVARIRDHEAVYFQMILDGPMLSAFDAVCPRPSFFDDTPFLSCLGTQKESFLAGESCKDSPDRSTAPPSSSLTSPCATSGRVCVACTFCRCARHGMSVTYRQTTHSDLVPAAGGREGAAVLSTWGD
jgi:hypothetical protein